MLRRVIPLLLALAASPALAVPQLEDESLSLTQVVDELSLPTALDFIGPADLLVLEKNTGQVRRVTNGVLSPTPVLDLAVNGCNERGLLGIAVHPDFGASLGKDWVYLYYTSSGTTADITNCNPDEGGPNLLDRYEWNGSALVNRLSLHTLPSFESSHNGGALAFGPDGKLYGVNGDGEEDGPAQNNTTPPLVFDDTGVIFRLNEDGTIPTDNPFFTADMVTQPEDRYFAYGIRNSFGLAFDPFDPFSLWNTENGPGSFDEINRVVPGANSGWNKFMGPAGTLTPPGLVNLPGSTYIEPRFSIFVPVAPTGLAFASPNTSLGAAHEGNLFVADFLPGNIYEFPLNMARTALDVTDTVAENQGQLDDFRIGRGFDGISDLQEGPDGDLYAVAIGLGEVWRIRGGGGGPAPHDLAITKVKAPKKISLSETKPSVVKDLKLTLANQGGGTETIDTEAELTNLIGITWTSRAGPNALCPAPTATLEPPKKGFPVVLAPKKKLSVSYAVTWDCANDDAQSSKTEDHADFEVAVTLDHAAIDGETDPDPSDDDCPRPASGDDKGCGGKDANGAIGGPITTDVVVK